MDVIIGDFPVVHRLAEINVGGVGSAVAAVSYTHLDVYKRQLCHPRRGSSEQRGHQPDHGVS